MNRKGFTLIELLGCLMLLGAVLCIGIYSTRGTLATTLSTLTNVSESEIYSAAGTYILENGVTWINGEDEYTCVLVRDLVSHGYFSYDDVSLYINDSVKIIREEKTRVIKSYKLLSDCN